MKEYRVRYSIGAYVYESVIWTSSSQAAILWANSIGGTNISVVGDE